MTTLDVVVEDTEQGNTTQWVNFPENKRQEISFWKEVSESKQGISPSARTKVL